MALIKSKLEIDLQNFQRFHNWYVFRFHKVKNHEYLFRALSILQKKNLKFKLLLLGPNINLKNKELILKLRKNNILKILYLLIKKKFLMLINIFLILTFIYFVQKRKDFQIF